MSALSAEMVEGTLPLKRFSFKFLRRRAIWRRQQRPWRCALERAYSSRKLVRAVMPDGIGPVRAFWFSTLKSNPVEMFKPQTLNVN